jgi:biofilm PGA synthesis protein PgaA
LESLGHAARAMGDAGHAVEYYRMAVSREADRAESVIGLAESLTDQGKANDAIDLLQPFIHRHPDNTDALIALANAYQRNNRLIDAVAAYERVLDIRPNDRESLRQRVFATDSLGVAPLALDMAQRHPELFTTDEMDTLTMDAAATYIRWGSLYHPVPARRFDDTDHAIGMLQDLLKRLAARGTGDSAAANRARFDLIVALHDRNRPRDALDLYEALQAKGTDIPDYVTQAAADAYAAVHQPERARDLYTQLLQRNPDDFQARMGLFYNAFDLNHPEQAYSLIDALAAEQKDPDLRLRAEDSAALARAWSDDLAAAQTRYEALTRAAPNNPYLHAQLAYVYLWRGWPRRALDEFRISRAIEPGVLSNHLGKIEAERARNDFAAASSQIADLAAAYPNDNDVDKLQRSWGIHNMRELWVQSSFTRSTGTQFGSRDLDLETYLYSQPLRINYRVYGHDYFSQSTFPEGKAVYHRLGAGLEYRARDVELSGELSDGAGRDRGVGLALHGTWMADDHWRFSGAYDGYSNEVPLRGRLNEDVHGWSLGGDTEYRVDESRSFAGGLEQLKFSDGNRRTQANASADQRLINRPHYKLNGRLAVYASRNTRAGASYYNPRSDLSLELSAVNEWLLMRRYDRSFLHRLGVSLGLYQENGFGNKPVGGLYYEHEWQFYDRLNLVYGVALNRPVYDGSYETHSRLYLNLHWRF